MATGAVPPPARKAGAVQTTKLGVGQAPVARQPAITAPTAGATVDAQARTAINDIITVLEAFGLVTPN